MSVKRIVIIAIHGGIGDLLMITPVFRKLKRTYPDSCIDVVTSFQKKAVIDSNEYVDRVFDCKEFDGSWKEDLGVGLLIRFLRGHQYSLCIVFGGRPQYDQLAHLIGGKDCLKVGYGPSSKEWLDKIVAGTDGHHDIQNNLASLKTALGLSIDDDDYTMDFNFSKRVEADVKKQIESLIGPSQKYLVIHPGCSPTFVFRRWGTADYIEISRFFQLKGFKVFITGQGEEGAVAADVRDGCPDGAFLFLNRPLPELAVLIKQASCVLCPDTGILHLTRAMQTPVVVLFGPTVLSQTGCIGQGLYKVIQGRAFCAPCLKAYDVRAEFQKVCDSVAPPAPCMASISSDEVVRSMSEMIDLHS